jgi:3'-phosphoadenosine 5'-phosphosulfate sulfotransferase (PAPS reductase)/FAD synthetase
MSKIAWFSCGATSAVACKLALQKYDDVEICYIETGSHHPDSQRFLQDCEKWFGKKITILQSKYKDVIDVIERTHFVNSPYGAACTTYLKTRVRQKFESEHPEITHYIWGFEKGAKEEKRAERMCERYPEYQHLFPLIETNLDKESCLQLLQEAGIEIPEMYKLGYHNNNCVGCVKGGMGYWNKIRKDFPDVFKRMAETERKVNAHCLKQYYLDELPEDAGRDEKELVPACSIFCGMINLEDSNE